MQFNIGALVSRGFNPYRSGPYEQLIAREFNLLESPIDWPQQRQANHVVTRGFLEGNVAFAGRSKMSMQAQALLWHGNVPEWLRNSPYSRAEFVQVIRERITSLMSNFKGRVSEWVVVNEPLHSSGRLGVTGDFFAERIGPEYVTIAHEAARNADDQAKLVLNDYGNHLAGQILERNLALYGDLSAKGLIDAIGIQMHLDAATPPSKQALLSTLRRLEQLGIAVRITELDVNLKNVSGTQEVRYARQADVYRTVMEAVIESGSCQSLSVQNPSDQYSWLQAPDAPAFGGPTANPTAWDDELKPKPAYYALFDTLKNATR